MKFAHFAHVWGKPGYTPAQRYELLWRELETADELGFDYGFCVEHHFRPDESWMSAPSLYTVGAGARTKRIRLGGMGHIVPLHQALRLTEEIAIADQMIGGRLEVGLVPGIVSEYFRPFNVDFESRRAVTLEYVHFLKAAFSDAESLTFDGKFHHADNVKLSVKPMQKPHPPLWIETRDPATLVFCAKEGISVGYFLLIPRDEAANFYRTYYADWKKAGHAAKPNIAYSTLVYVDETDEKALAKAMPEIAQGYRGFFPVMGDAELKAAQIERSEIFRKRGEHGAAEIIKHILDPEYLLSRDLVFAGSPETVTRKLKASAAEGHFNTFFGEFNFGNLAAEDVLRSIRLFGTEIVPALRDFEPF
jgi:alkanesulfonate monooxygenase SsuD/methylene tetrahydromethanopterin reductase-like flavin-dependent oxidoreductase (luciferase family)